MSNKSKMRGPIIVILGIVIVALLFIVPSYNKLVSEEENVKTKWSQVENMLERRSDLIPNLVNTVKGYASHEEEVFTAVSEARSKLAGSTTPNETTEANAEMESALSRLLAISESYPELKADANFRQLQDELAGTENRIAVARKDYNEAAQVFNTDIRRFPRNIIAGIFGFEAYQYFEATEGKTEVPKVEF